MKSINRKSLIFAIFYGVVFGGLTFRAIKPQGESFILSRDADGRYESVIEEEDYRVEVSEYGEGVISISFEPAVTWVHYAFFALAALFLGMTHYQNLVKEKEKGELSPDHLGTDDVSGFQSEDPEYQVFVSEDENRQLLPRPVLEEDFQKWRMERNEGLGKT